MCSVAVAQFLTVLCCYCSNSVARTLQHSWYDTIHVVSFSNGIAHDNSPEYGGAWLKLIQPWHIDGWVFVLAAAVWVCNTRRKFRPDFADALRRLEVVHAVGDVHAWYLDATGLLQGA